MLDARLTDSFTDVSINHHRHMLIFHPGLSGRFQSLSPGMAQRGDVSIFCKPLILPAGLGCALPHPLWDGAGPVLIV